MKLIWNNNYTKYVIVLVLLLFIVFFLYFDKTVENVTNYTAKEDCGEFTIANRRITNEISNMNIQATLSGGVMTKVNDCITLINEINQYLPNSINDITIGSVTQISDANTKPSINIKVTGPSKSRLASVQTSGGSSPSPSGSSPSPSPGGSSISTGSSITDITLPTEGATWTIDFVLPKGYVGATGEQGPPGQQGPDGQDGKMGPTGTRGPGGSEPNSQYYST
jgi:hypothetical protein